MTTGIFDVVEFESICRARNILIVEDNVFAAKSLRMALALNGHEVEIVYDGNSAIESVIARKPDVVLLDIGLPGIDGYEVARRIRATPSLKDLLLIAITGYGQSQDRARSEAAGIDVHLVKPVAIEELEEVIASRTPFE